MVLGIWWLLDITYWIARGSGGGVDNEFKVHLATYRACFLKVQVNSVIHTHLILTNEIIIMSPYHWWQRWWFALCEWNSWSMTTFICQIMWWNHQRLGSNCYFQVFFIISYKQMHPWNWTSDGIRFSFDIYDSCLSNILWAFSWR
jgi:hypothetical protein